MPGQSPAVDPLIHRCVKAATPAQALGLWQASVAEVVLLDPAWAKNSGLEFLAALFGCPI
ncbi:MAG: hypothetical protein WBB18_12395 [Nodosilinea sp.]